MKVLFVASGNHGGGVTPIITNQGDSLIRNGVDVDYYAKVGTGIIGNIKSIFDLRKHIKNGGYDVVHAHFWITAITTSFALIGLRKNVVFVVSLMGDDVKKSKLLKSILRLASYLFHWRKIVVKSQDMYDALRLKQTVIIPNGVNMERFKALDKITCQHQLSWEVGGLHILFPASSTRDVKDFPLAQKAVEQLKSLIANQVILHAFENVPNHQTPYYYNAADVVLMTSKWEGSPNAIKEAMACGRPIVTTNVGDVQERLSGVEGCYVVDSRDPLKLAQAVEYALHSQNSKGRERLIGDGLMDNQIAQKLIQIYKEQ